MTKRKPPEQHRKPGPKPGVKRSAAPKAAPKAAVQPPDPKVPPKSVDIDSLAGEDLRAYARRIGVKRQDCESLTEDRLRQNCKAFLQHHYELLTED